MPNIGPIAGIILAAGMSRRLGRPKQLLKIGAEFIINRVVDAALDSELDNVTLVLGHCRDEIQSVLGQRLSTSRLQIVRNPDYRRGQSRSLHHGVRAVRSGFPACMFILADQPLLDRPTINLLIERFYQSDRGICVPRCRGQRKNPTLFNATYYDRLLGISGDTGARGIIASQPEDVLCVDIEHPDIFLDVDTPEDLIRVETLFQKSRQIEHEAREDHQDDHT